MNEATQQTTETEQLRKALAEMVSDRNRLNQNIRNTEENLFLADSADVLRDIRQVAEKYKDRFTSRQQVTKIVRAALREFKIVLMESLYEKYQLEREARYEQKERAKFERKGLTTAS